MTDKMRKELRGNEMVFIPQSVTYLDPVMRVGKQVQGIHGTEEKQRAAFERYGLKQEAAQMYPFQLSGGMTRRALISTAVITKSKLILADEPTPGLSEDIALETMRNFRELADEGNGVLMITHDIDIALNVADTIAVFYDGRTVEVCSREAFLQGGDALKHPYSRALWAALPQNGFIAADPVEIMREYELTKEGKA